MDCVDCHNRPAHVYLPPEQAVDQSLLAHRLDIPCRYIKQQAVAALTGKYETTDAAMQGIATTFQGSTKANIPDLAKTKQLEIRNAIDEVQQIFRRTYLPGDETELADPSQQSGHLYFNGCFRCHDGQHVSPEGKVVSKDCDLCHTVMGQAGGRSERGCRAQVKLSTSSGLGRSDPGELQRLPYWRREPVGSARTHALLRLRIASTHAAESK